MTPTQHRRLNTALFVSVLIALIIVAVNINNKVDNSMETCEARLYEKLVNSNYRFSKEREQ